MFVTKQYISVVLRNDLGARYKRISKAPELSNNDKSLILRRKFAEFMIDQLSQGVRVINVD